MSAADDLADKIIQRQLDVNRYVGSITQRINGVLADLSADIEDTFKGDIQNYSQVQLGELLREVKGLVDDTFFIFFNELIAEFEEFGRNEAQTVVDDTNTIFGLLFFAKAISDTQVKKITNNPLVDNLPLKDWQKRLTGDAYFKLNQAIRSGINAKESNGKIMARIFDESGRNRSAINVISQNVNNIVKTAVADIVSQIQLATYASNKKNISFIQHISVLDNKTSDVCIARAGLLWEYPSLEPNGHKLAFRRPPLHINCRSRVTIIPSFDKTPVKDLTFDKFLQSKSKAYQDETLGKGKAELWRQGKISLTQLIDQTNNPLTLNELRKKTS